MSTSGSAISSSSTGSTASRRPPRSGPTTSSKERLEKIPSKERQEAWLRVARRPFTQDEEAEARRKLVLLLDKMEASLKQHAWLVGESYSLADIGVVPFVKRIDEEIAPDEVSENKHPRVLAWWTGGAGAAGLRRGEDRSVRRCLSALVIHDHVTAYKSRANKP